MESLEHNVDYQISLDGFMYTLGSFMGAKMVLESLLLSVFERDKELNENDYLQRFSRFMELCKAPAECARDLGIHVLETALSLGLLKKEQEKYHIIAHL